MEMAFQTCEPPAEMGSTLSPLGTSPKYAEDHAWMPSRYPSPMTKIRSLLK